jgi:hypothetical protein
MNSTKDEALKMAMNEIAGWLDHAYGITDPSENEVWKACKEALEQPAQEPEYVYVNPVTKDAYYLIKAINACKEALEQQAQEPLGYVDAEQFRRWVGLKGTQYESAERTMLPFSTTPYKDDLTDCSLPLYTHPAQPLNKTAERDYNFMRDLAIGAEELLSKTIKELDEVKELLAQRNLELIVARDMLLNKHME